jgi:hypothetical protein
LFLFRYGDERDKKDKRNERKGREKEKRNERNEEREGQARGQGEQEKGETRGKRDPGVVTLLSSLTCGTGVIFNFNGGDTSSQERRRLEHGAHALPLFLFTVINRAEALP